MLRFVTSAIRPSQKYFQPVEEKLVSESGIHREAIHHLEQLADGTVVSLYELSGDTDRILDILGEYGAESSGQVSMSGNTLFVHSHFEPSPIVEQLLRLRDDYPFTIDMPMCFIDDGYLRITVVASDETCSTVFGALPDRVDVRIEKTGTYDAGNNRILSYLTEWQREILRTAMEMGYYEVPQKATLVDLAQALDIASGTVGEHLRHIEANVMSAIRS